MVVRNHEGGTSTSAWQRRVPKGARSPEWTLGGDVGGRANANLTRGRRRREAAPTLAGALRSGGQGHEGGHSSISVEEGCRVGKPSRTSRQRQKVEEGAGKAKRPATGATVGVEQHRFPALATPAALKTTPTAWELPTAASAAVESHE